MMRPTSRLVKHASNLAPRRAAAAPRRAPLWLCCLVFAAALLPAAFAGAQTAGSPASAPGTSDETAQEPATERPTLAQLAATSDVVGIAQVYYTDYEYSHSYPVSGTAYLRMLITYRSDQLVQDLRVKEKGLHNGECYFPATSYTKDGPRFLVFLARRPDGDFIGNPRLCMVPVAVTSEQGYAVPLPRPELDLTAAGEAAIREIEFSDTNATVDASEMTRSMAAKKAAELGGEVRGDRIVFTRGIPISDVRKLLGEENLKLPRLNR